MADLLALLSMLANQGLEEIARLAWVASRVGPALAVVGGAAVSAGLLGAASIRRVRRTRYQALGRSMEAPSPGAVPWALGALLLAGAFTTTPAGAEVLCRKGASPRLMLRDACRAREHAVESSELDLGPRETCLDVLALAWDDLALLRTYLEAARDLATQLEVRPWDDRGIRLAIYAAAIVATLDTFEGRLDALGVAGGRLPVVEIRRLVATDWTHPLDACTQALGILPALEAAVPLLPAG